MKTVKTKKKTRESLVRGYIKDGDRSREPKKPATEIYVAEIKQGITTFYLVGSTPLLINRMSGRNKRDILLPPLKKTKADKASTLKHDPIAEFRSSIHRMPPGSKTLLGFPAAGPKRAMASIAVDVPGSSKAQIGRLVRVLADDTQSNLISVWGLPKLHMPIVRNSDINRTPDVRSVARVDQWVMRVRVMYPISILNPTPIFNLLVAAGNFIGLGDGRQEKGKLDFGCFQVITEKEVGQISDVMKIGYKEQEKAMERAEPCDLETLELLTWYNDELKRRGKEKPDDQEK